MRLRQLQLRVQTNGGLFGTTLEFPDGLVVVWADNTMGKSTCMKAILVALGLEAMLTTNQADLPLPPALTHELNDDERAAVYAVIESDVYLELENSKAERITVRRTIKGSRDKNLITVIRGPALTSNSDYATEDFFVNRSGGATREAGFHFFLASFLGWQLPLVQTFDGGEYPLYLQCIFPYLFVEQTRGWSSIVPPVPLQLRIRDASKRVVEFLLNLDAYRVALRRQELLFEKGRLEAGWTTVVRGVKDIADRLAAVSHGIPNVPTTEWPPKVVPTIQISGEGGWVPLTSRIEISRKELDQLLEQEIPRVEEIATVAGGQLFEAEAGLRDKEALLGRLMNELELERSEAAEIAARISTLDIDIQRNKDIRTLESLGSKKMETVVQHSCPTCHQSIQDSLVLLEGEQKVMPIEDNISFLSEQRHTFANTLKNVERIVFSRERQIRTLQTELTELRDRIRALRQTLISDGRLPSVAAIQARLRLETTIQRDEQGYKDFTGRLRDFAELAKLWLSVQSELANMPKEDTTDSDKEKLRTWSTILRQQLQQYGFQSLPIAQISISPDSYRPEHEGFDLPTSISASDVIRMIWSYLHGMLEMSRSGQTKHPGLLCFDEPRQQSTRDVSFEQLLVRASSAHAVGQQVIFFTSENMGRLQEHLQALPHALRPIIGRALKRVRA